MKAAVQFAASLIAAAGLMVGAASHATDVATLPLKASVLAKPNIIFGLDDSGSMDSELMLNTNDGAFWWDYTNAKGWDTAGKPVYNTVGDASTQYRKMPYLFPIGTASGARVYGDSTNDHFATMPTPQFAWLRSSSYNPLYYNPSVSYKAWAPAYVGSAVVNYANATTTGAKSHPAVGTVTQDLTKTISANTTAHYSFMAMPGMVVPSGAKVCDHTGSCSSSTNWTTLTADTTVASGKIYRVAMDYFPATYYVKESCTLSGAACVSAPDGATLKRYEIKPANYTSTSDYNAAIQNFANWWQYYRKRKLMLGGAMGKVLEPLTGLRLGVVIFNSHASVTMYDTDATAASANGRRVAGVFYTTSNSGGTPTRETLKYIGDQFLNTSGIIQYACQRNNAFVVTDGFANATTVKPPTYSQATWGTGAPYQTIFDNTLADIALSYFTNNLKSTLTLGKVPPTTTDLNTNLHMNTYGLTLGAMGSLWAGDGTARPTSTGAWPNPNTDRNPTAVDDLWHATINGRGKMYTAQTPDETAARIQAAMDDVLSATGAQSGVAVSTVNLSRGDGYAYLGTYNPAGWTGDLTANPINATNAVISTTPTWSAGAILLARDWTTRVIASVNSSGTGVGFTATDVGGTVNPSSTWGDTTQVMNYLRGDRSLEGSTFRTRTSLLGAVINSEPTIDRDTNMVYVASGEGMLHAVDSTPGSTAGKELWAFVPRENLQDMGQTTGRHYVFQTQLDGTPVVGQSGSTSKLLVAGMGAAGRSYYAIDVTSPRSYTEAQLASAYKWEFPTAADTTTRTKVGQTLGKPAIVRTAGNGYVVLVTSGYNSTADGKGRLWMLNAADGTVIKEFVVNAGALGAESGLTQVSGFLEDDGTVQYAYGGDLLGNLWRFDLKNLDTPKLVAVLKNAGGVAQPVTAAPEMALVQNQRVILIGTGRILDITDFGNSTVQTFYAIADGDTISPARDSLVQQTYTRTGDVLSSNPVDWTVKRGWYMDLPAGEQANTHPRISYNAVSFVTNVTGANDCSASSYLYVLDVASGNKVVGASYVSMQVSDKANASGPTPVASSTGQPYDLLQTNDGQAKTETLPMQTGVQSSKNSWREVVTQ